ncbi:hypothetical protein B0H17DRAFT_1145199 [Mycena rosella]|uniref:Uncharacterized protein n=1 Tax=Mycena rosella TaxID=1033263 RepID=A0AAD7G4V9_MYCRO|nr:hypothetical protein B0H17DRAFT_1145199 [Mycena rosella]
MLYFSSPKLNCLEVAISFEKFDPEWNLLRPGLKLDPAHHYPCLTKKVPISLFTGVKCIAKEKVTGMYEVGGWEIKGKGVRRVYRDDRRDLYPKGNFPKGERKRENLTIPSIDISEGQGTPSPHRRWWHRFVGSQDHVLNLMDVIQLPEVAFSKDWAKHLPDINCGSFGAMQLGTYVMCETFGPEHLSNSVATTTRATRQTLLHTEVARAFRQLSILASRDADTAEDAYFNLHPHTEMPAGSFYVFLQQNKRTVGLLPTFPGRAEVDYVDLKFGKER